MEVLAWPSWSAAAREESPAWSMKVATVLRKTWEVTQSKPAAAKASAGRPGVVEGSRQPPNGAVDRLVALALPARLPRGPLAQHPDASVRQHEGAGPGIGLGPRGRSRAPREDHASFTEVFSPASTA